MTHEEAIKVLECMAVDLTGCMGGLSDKNPLEDVCRQRLEAINTVLFVLNPVSQEQVEKMWRGCDYCHMKEVLFNDGTLRVEIGHQNIVGGACIDIDQYGGFGIDYCPKCGKPLTNEAVQIVIERLEALNENRD